MTTLVIRINGRLENVYLDSKITVMKRNKWQMNPLISILDDKTKLELELWNDDI